MLGGWADAGFFCRGRTRCIVHRSTPAGTIRRWLADCGVTIGGDELPGVRYCVAWWFKAEEEDK